MQAGLEKRRRRRRWSGRARSLQHLMGLGLKSGVVCRVPKPFRLIHEAASRPAQQRGDALFQAYLRRRAWAYGRSCDPLRSSHPGRGLPVVFFGGARGMKGLHLINCYMCCFIYSIFQRKRETRYLIEALQSSEPAFFRAPDPGLRGGVDDTRTFEHSGFRNPLLH